MHIITRKRLNEFAAAHPDAKPALQQWYKRIGGKSLQNFAELRDVFPAADEVGKLTVFLRERHVLSD
jgi:mRNA interferase HigB